MGPTSAAVGMGGQRSEGSAPRHGGGGNREWGLGAVGAPRCAQPWGGPIRGTSPKASIGPHSRAPT